MGGSRIAAPVIRNGLLLGEGGHWPGANPTPPNHCHSRSTSPLTAARRGARLQTRRQNLQGMHIAAPSNGNSLKRENELERDSAPNRPPSIPTDSALHCVSQKFPGIFSERIRAVYRLAGIPVAGREREADRLGERGTVRRLSRCRLRLNPSRGFRSVRRKSGTRERQPELPPSAMAKQS